MDEIRTQLNTQIEAMSDLFGEYQEQISLDIQATAAGINQKYTDLETIITNNEANENFIQELRGYIYSGLIDIDGNGTKKVGIAIGQNVVVNGNLVEANKAIAITSDKIIFFEDGVPIGYYEGDHFYIAKGQVNESMQMGNFVWMVFSNNSLGLMKI